MQKSYLDKAMIFLGIAFIIGSYLISTAINRVADYGQALTNSAAQINSQLANMSNFLNGLSRLTTFAQPDDASALSTANQQPIMLTKEEALRYLNLTESGLIALINESDIPYIKLNHSYLFPRNALEEWVKNAGKERYQLTFP